MDNAHLFELLHAGPALAPAKLMLMLMLSQWLIVAVPVGLGWAWARGAAAHRPDLLEMMLAAVLALGVSVYPASQSTRTWGGWLDALA